MSEQLYCIDCLCKITRRHKRCRECYYKSRIGKEINRDFKGKNNPRYIDGHTLKEYFCVDCGKKLSIRAIRCHKCANSKEHNPSYIDGRSYDLNLKKKYRRDYQNKRKLYDLNFKIRCYLTTRIWFALKGLNKSTSTAKLLGCSYEFFRVWFTLQFWPGMSWKNMGKWHIDHIRPCSSFDLSLPEHQQACFHYTNLQPLWAIDNRRKSDTYV